MVDRETKRSGKSGRPREEGGGGSSGWMMDELPTRERLSDMSFISEQNIKKVAAEERKDSGHVTLRLWTLWPKEGVDARATEFINGVAGCRLEA